MKSEFRDDTYNVDGAIRNELTRRDGVADQLKRTAQGFQAQAQHIFSEQQNARLRRLDKRPGRSSNCLS